MTRFEDVTMPRSRPHRADHDANGYGGRLRHELGPVDVHAHPSGCPHPVEARVTASIPGYVARCADCGSHLDRVDLEWVVLRWRPEP